METRTSDSSRGRDPRCGTLWRGTNITTNHKRNELVQNPELRGIQALMTPAAPTANKHYPRRCLIPSNTTSLFCGVNGRAMADNLFSFLGRVWCLKQSRPNSNEHTTLRDLTKRHRLLADKILVRNGSARSPDKAVGGSCKPIYEALLSKAPGNNHACICRTPPTLRSHTHAIGAQVPKLDWN